MNTNMIGSLSPTSDNVTIIIVITNYFALIYGCVCVCVCVRACTCVFVCIMTSSHPIIDDDVHVVK